MKNKKETKELQFLIHNPIAFIVSLLRNVWWN